ncbi:MAG: hypothetical protein ACRYF3_13190, partial [Janthinobacterium lividum]
RNGTWEVLGWLVMLMGMACAAGFVVTPARLRKFAIILVLSGTVVGLGGTASYAVATAANAHTGSIPSVGPTSAAGASGMGGFGGTGGGGARAVPGTQGTQEGTAQDGTAQDGTAQGGTAQDGGQRAAGGMGGEGASTDAELITLLQGAGTTWAAAVSGSQSAASLELAADVPVMAMGGWSNDPTPTLAQFKAYVAAGEVHYLVSGSGAGGPGMGGGGGAGNGSEITDIQSWVADNFTALAVGGQTVYDLTQPLTSSAT